MPGGVLSTTHDTPETGAALDTKRLAAAWLLGGVVPFSLWYVHYGGAPLTAAEHGPFVTAFADVCAVLFFLWRWPRVFGLSRLRPRMSDLCRRTSVLWAVLTTAAAAAVLHEGPYFFVPQLFLCGAYLARRRCLPASIAAHAVTNALCWWPKLMVAAHFAK